jgi:1-acyl-sn-glycerol-3-phosphate acyltransferase
VLAIEVGPDRVGRAASDAVGSMHVDDLVVPPSLTGWMMQGQTPGPIVLAGPCVRALRLAWLGTVVLGGLVVCVGLGKVASTHLRSRLWTWFFTRLRKALRVKRVSIAWDQSFLTDQRNVKDKGLADPWVEGLDLEKSKSSCGGSSAKEQCPESTTRAGHTISIAKTLGQELEQTGTSKELTEKIGGAEGEGRGLATGRRHQAQGAHSALVKAVSSGRVVMANHCSYVDIPVFASLFACHFVSKEEVAKWPIVGAVARCLGCVFVSRRPSQVLRDLREISKSLRPWRSLVMFPEGTTSDGCRILPLKSSYFQLPSGTLVQPAIVEYACAGGLPLRHSVRKLYSWRGQVPLFPHLWWLVGLPAVHARIRFSAPLAAGSDRKALALACQQAMEKSPN